MADNKNTRSDVEAINNMRRKGAVQLITACVVVHNSRPLNRPCCLILRISSLLLDKRTNKRAFAFLRISAVRPGTTTKTHPERTPTVRGGGLQSHRKTPLVHKAAILNSLTGQFQEANKRDSKCDTVHFVCASANSVARCPIKSDRRRFVPT